MSDEGQIDQEEQELEAMRKTLEEKVEAEQNPEPEPEPEEPKVEAQAEPEEPNTEPQEQRETVQPVAEREEAKAESFDPMEYVKKKGLDTPEKAARAYVELEKQFHKRNQKGHPGYQDLNNGNPAPQPPINNGWQPQAPPPSNPSDVAKNIARRYQMDPEDVERLLPMIVDTASAISTRTMSQFQREMQEIRQQTSKQEEMNQLMQDPLFHNPAIKMEMHEILSKGNIAPGDHLMTRAFQQATINAFRKKELQGSQKPASKPPVTAGGGNGSFKAGTQRIDTKSFDKMSIKEQEALLKKLA